ncbi:hypothetical protein CHS0354_009629 [Potamilus streckersoni]|uniref:Uncharacterized protein n=1 Tax=Potamilus streckersoni TaxID=2493646 RepID=A0AAE0S403_9BIVA|nr:hypothetical protein CHS0354_009629 [Potamilus streckersoni]
MANSLSSISMDSTPEVNGHNVDVPPGWNNLQARRRRNALGDIFLDQDLPRGTPLRAASSAECLNDTKRYSNKSKRADDYEHGADNYQEKQVINLWRQTARQRRRNGERNILSFAEKVLTTR